MSDQPITATFTPLMDSLVMKYGLITAALWGRMWRYSQGSGGVCNAGIERIAKEIGIGRQTAIRHLETLKEGGHLVDLTPDLRHRPHTYRVISVPESNTQLQASVPESNTGVPESNTQCTREVLKETETIKKDYPSDFPKTGKSLDPKAFSPGQAKFLHALGAKRFKTAAQKDKVLRLEEKYGLSVLTEYITWAAEKGLSLGDAVVAADKSLAKWGSSKNGGVIRVEAGRL